MMLMLHSVGDWLRRRRAHLEATPLDCYEVRVARELAEYEDAFKLLHLVYAFQGHVPVSDSDLRITPQHVLPESTVLVAYEGDMLVGTITVTLDSPAGIPLDRVFPEAVERLRRSGPVAELGSLAVVRRCWSSGVTTLLWLASYRFARYILGAHTAVIGVTPSFAGFYRALFNFAPLAPPGIEPGTGQMLLGMAHELGAVPDFIRRNFKTPLASGLTLAQHMVEEPPACISLPTDVPLEELGRWKMSREVFRELFIEQVNRIDSLDPATLRHLMQRRSRHTLDGTRSPQPAR